MTDTDHPRPQLTRPEWTDLSGTWAFAYDDDDEGLRETWQSREDVFDRSIVVPFPPESERSGIADRGYHPVLWYRRTFRCVPEPGHRVVLHLGAVDYRARVWVNGRLVAVHEGGSTPFSADVTADLSPAGEQVVVVRAEDQPEDLAQPRGKQDWQPEPHAIWYDRTSGIWQPVWYEQVPESHIARVQWTPDVDRATIALSVGLRRAAAGPFRLNVRLSLHGRLLADDTYVVTSDALTRDIALAQTDMTLGRSEALWSPDSPNLLDAVLTLLDESGTVVDRVHSYTAMRSVAANGRRLLLNGRPYYLRLVLAQGFWPESHLAAPSADALRREVELVKELGFNGIRVHQKIEDPRLLAWCDRLGLLVWAELPAAYEFSNTSVARLTREWIEVVERDSSHPCIVAWVPVNESWGVPALERSDAQRALVLSLYHLTRALDPNRLVIGNDGWEQIMTDVLTVHDYTASGVVLRQRYGDHEAVERTLAHIQPGYRSVLLPGATRDDEPVVLSEFGGISYSAETGDQWEGYGAVRSPEALLARFRELVTALLDSTAVNGFCYTQLTDTRQERNGLLTDRREHKLDPDEVRAILFRPSAAVAGDQVGVFEYGDYPPGSTPASL